ncbi:unnamed protein product [Caretta caretta]
MGCTMDSTQWITGLTSVSQKVSCPLSDNTPFGTQPSESKETCRTVSLRLQRSFSDQTSTLYTHGTDSLQFQHMTRKQAKRNNQLEESKKTRTDCCKQYLRKIQDLTEHGDLVTQSRVLHSGLGRVGAQSSERQKVEEAHAVFPDSSELESGDSEVPQQRQKEAEALQSSSGRSWCP